MGVRLAIYNKDSAKPIVLTDDSADYDIIQKMIYKAFESKNIYCIQTQKDCLIGRPSELQSVLVSSSDNRNQSTPEASPPKAEIDEQQKNTDQ